MKFEVKDKLTGRVLFTAEIEAKEDDPTSLKLGLAVKWGVKNDADLCRTDLRGADLCGTDLSGTNLSGVDLRGSDLCGTNLRGVDLRGTDLREVDLRGTDLRGTDLRGSDLRGTNLSGVDLSWTDLRGTILRGVDLLVIHNIGSEAGTLIATWKGSDCYITRGCFNGSLDEFKAAVDENHKGTKFHAEYMMAIDLIKLKMEINE